MRNEAKKETRIESLTAISLKRIRQLKYSKMEYEDIRRTCLQTGELFEDPDFPTQDSIIGITIRDVQWKRPKEVCEEPMLTVDVPQKTDFIQGKIGNCWFASAIGALTANPNFFRVLCQPTDQGFETGKYCGAFCFNFWQYEKWTTVIIDDRLPTVDNRLVFLHSKNENEFLGALVEKAYAKIHGSYEALRGGHAADAMTDLTGGFVDFITNPSEVINRVQEALVRGSLAVASITEKSEESRIMRNGLSTNHAYNVLECEQVASNDGQNICLLHLRDPKGLGNWNGAWAYESENWENLPGETVTRLKENTTNGEFWLSYTDFEENMTSVEICNCANATDDSDSESTGQKIAIARGEWLAGSSDDTFYEDPQFELTVNSSNDEDANFVVELTQLAQRQDRCNLSIRFRLFRLEDGETAPLNEEQLDNRDAVSKKNLYTNSRSFVEHFTVPPGRYVLVASTERTSKAAQFVIRMFSSTESAISSNLKA